MFTDKQRQPAPEEILLALGPSRPAWESLEQYLGENYRLKKDFAFYGKNYGWALRFRKSGKALLSLYPRQGGFTVQIVLGEPQVQQALLSGVGPAARKAIEAANAYAEGRWLFIPVETMQEVEEVKYLLGLKAKPGGS
jgi:hypothetical protein